MLATKERHYHTNGGPELIHLTREACLEMYTVFLTCVNCVANYTNLHIHVMGASNPIDSAIWERDEWIAFIHSLNTSNTNSPSDDRTEAERIKRTNEVFVLMEKFHGLIRFRVNVSRMFCGSLRTHTTKAFHRILNRSTALIVNVKGSAVIAYLWISIKNVSVTNKIHFITCFHLHPFEARLAKSLGRLCFFVCFGHFIKVTT